MLFLSRSSHSSPQQMDRDPAARDHAQAAELAAAQQAREAHESECRGLRDELQVRSQQVTELEARVRQLKDARNKAQRDSDERGRKLALLQHELDDLQAQQQYAWQLHAYQVQHLANGAGAAPAAEPAGVPMEPPPEAAVSPISEMAIPQLPTYTATPGPSPFFSAD